MTTNRRTVLAGALGLAGAGLIGAAGCAPAAPTPGTGPTGSGTPAAPPAPKGELLVWDFGTEALATYEDKLFAEEFPEVKLTHVVHPITNYETLLQTAITSPSGPDVIMIGGGLTVGRFAKALLPLDNRLSADEKANLIGLDVMREKHDPANPLLGMPFSLQTWVWYYNKELLTQAGLDPATPPASVPELLEACTKLKAAGITPISIGDGENVQGQIWFEALQGSFMDAAAALDVAKGTKPWASPEIQSVFQTFLDLANGGFFQPSWRSDSVWTQQPDLFSAGKAAITMTMTSYAGIFSKALGADKVGVFFNPAAEKGGKRKYMLGGPSLAMSVTRRSQNPDAAFAYASWKVSRKSQERDLAALSGENTMQNGRLPTRKDVAIPSDALPTVKTMAQAFATETLALSTLSLALAPAQVGTDIIQRFGSVIDNKLTLPDFLAGLDKAMKA